MLPPVERFSTNGFLVTDRGLTSSGLAHRFETAIANQKTLPNVLDHI
jgi:hypothetical protein